MQKGQKAIVWFEEVGRKDIPLVGGKGATLGEMTQAGIPVSLSPPTLITISSRAPVWPQKSPQPSKVSIPTTAKHYSKPPRRSNN
jgi:hypothetical protein